MILIALVTVTAPVVLLPIPERSVAAMLTPASSFIIAFAFIVVEPCSDPFASYLGPWLTMVVATSTAPSSITSPPFPMQQPDTLLPTTFTTAIVLQFLPWQARPGALAVPQQQVAILVIGLRAQQDQLVVGWHLPLHLLQVQVRGLVERPSFLFCLFINKNMS